MEAASFSRISGTLCEGHNIPDENLRSYLDLSMCMLLTGKYMANVALLGVTYLKDSMNGATVMCEAKMWEKWHKRTRDMKHDNMLIND